MDTTTTTLDQSQLNSLLNASNGGGSLIPEALVLPLTIGFIVLNVLGLISLILWLAVLIRNWKVQTAVLKTQKDVADIKAHLTKADEAPAAQTTPNRAEPEPNRVIAQADSPRPRSELESELGQPVSSSDTTAPRSTL